MAQLKDLIVTGASRFLGNIYGNLKGNADTATTSTKLGSSSVGSGVKPIYLNAGTATASSSTVGSSSLPVYMSSGTITQCSTTLGVSITGNSATATKATQDGSGNNIVNTYATKTALNGYVPLATYNAKVQELTNLITALTARVEALENA